MWHFGSRLIQRDGTAHNGNGKVKQAEALVGAVAKRCGGPSVVEPHGGPARIPYAPRADEDQDRIIPVRSGRRVLR